MVIKAEGGLKNHRLEWVAETTQGEAPTDPAWNLFSDTVRSFEWSPDSQIETTYGIGDAEPSAFLKGPEQHEFTVTYDLQQKSGTGESIVTAGGDTNDASYDGLTRDADNLLQASHTIVNREDKPALTAEETVNGTTSKDTRIYTVALGCLHDEVVYTGDPGSQQPVQVEITYQAEKVRSYQIDQPGTSDTLDVVSTDSADTMDLEVESEGAGATDTITLTGTSAATGTTSFTDIDALYLTAEPQGDITISETTSGDTLAVIPGKSSYQDSEGDRGVPLLGAGSHASAIGQDFEIVIGDTIERPVGTNLAFDINSAEISVSNNIERTNRVDKLSQRLHAGNHDIMLTATVLGESESHDQLLEHLQVNESNAEWNMSGAVISLTNTALTGPGSRSIEAGQAVMTVDSEFQAKDISVASS